jgi:menaquinone-dependent protoporphyrinogen oxidase
MKMKVLVVYASKHGSTKGIADFIGEKLRERGLEAEVRDVANVEKPEAYDAFVLGSAVYMGHWMKEAKQFVSRNRAILTARPVWLFSSGPIGKEMTDAKGRDLLDPTVSGPVELPALEGEIHVRDHRIFFGALDANKIGFFYRQLRKSETIRKAMQEGDFRDWAQIEAWADSIAGALQESPKPTIKTL